MSMSPYLYIFTREISFVICCWFFLFCTPIHFWKAVSPKRKYFAVREHIWQSYKHVLWLQHVFVALSNVFIVSKCFPFRRDSFSLCFLARQIPSEKGSALKGKTLLPKADRTLRITSNLRVGLWPCTTDLSTTTPIVVLLLKDSITFHGNGNVHLLE